MTMTRVLISADMEGATGTVLPTDVEAGTPEYQRFRRLLTGDVNAAVAGFADAGADEVIVNDAHCGMNNVLIEELDPRALLITGRHKPLGMMQGLEDGDDATCHQAAGYAPGCRTVAVKKAVSRHAAVCRTPAATSAEIRREAAAALNAPPTRPAPEVTGHVVEVDLDSPHQADRACSLPGVTASGPRRVCLESPDAREALRRFRALTWVIGGGREDDWT